MPADPPSLEMTTSGGSRIGSIMQLVLPILVGVLLLVAWEAFVRLDDIPPYILPGPR
jgi:ABC-type nitrate/sulfonate/bicarbonate transport system permease component